MRDNVKYYPKLLERTGHRFTLHVSDTSTAVTKALPAFFDLHRARANAPTAVAHRDKFAHRDRRSFLSEVAPVLADLGRLKVGLLQVDDAVVAAQIWLEMRDTMFIYYTGWDPDWSKYSVQLVATLECLKHGIGRGITRVEFLRGGAEGRDQRNERWETTRRVRVNVTLARTPAVAKLVLRVPRIQRRLRLNGTTLGPDTLNWTPAP
jgi:CelD/BcsL family acetyltransferase involved in cellulose biosynthesis